MRTEDKNEIVNELEDISNEVSCIIQEAIEKIQDIQSENSSLVEWKSIVINNLPANCSLQFRQDVEEFLNKIKFIY